MFKYAVNSSLTTTQKASQCVIILLVFIMVFIIYHTNPDVTANNHLNVYDTEKSKTSSIIVGCFMANHLCL